MRAAVIVVRLSRDLEAMVLSRPYRRAMSRMRSSPPASQWAFARRFRRSGFGWRSAPAVSAVREAIGEVKRVARGDAALGAEGSVALLVRLVPALERVDGSSGAIGTAVNDAVASFAPIVGSAPLTASQR